MTDFDQQLSRKNTNSVKWDGIVQTYHKEDLIPLWVADMDFMAPTPVIEALTNYSQQGIFGYSVTPDSLYEAIIAWENERYGYQLEKKDILFSPGVVPSIGVAIQAYTKPGDTVLIHDPVYHPFANMVKANGRIPSASPLHVVAGRFQMDLADMEARIKKDHIKLFILCNPHNPGGRVWEQEELLAVGRLCQKYGVIVVADEIHQDLVFAPHRHVSFQTVAPDFADFSLILTAATKTFNLAGIKHSMVYIKNPSLRKAFKDIQEMTEQATISTFGLLGTETAYRQGGEWLTELLAYLAANSRFTQEYFANHLPQVTMMAPEGTYLAWLDFSAFGLSDQQLQTKMIEEAGVVLNAGTIFGKQGTGHMRLNLACPKATLEAGLERIVKAFQE